MKKVVRIISIVLCIIPICVFIYFETMGQKMFDIYSSNKILLLILELLNIVVTFFIFKKRDKLNSKIYVVLIIYLIIIAMIPCYNTSKTYAPTGPQSELMGLALERHLRDMFGIKLK